MKDNRNREMFASLYRLLERYETAPVVKDNEEGIRYFEEVLTSCNSFYNEYADSKMAKELILAFFSAVEAKYKEANKDLIGRRSA